MKACATWSFEPWLSGHSQPWSTVEDFLATAVSSIDHAARHIGPVQLYTDSLGYYVFKTLAVSASIEVCYDNLHQQIPQSLWAYSKILTYSQQIEPFTHFDLDFITVDQLPFTDSDLGFQVLEQITTPQRDLSTVYNLSQVAEHYQLPPLVKKYQDQWLELKPPCMGVYCCNNITLNQIYTDTAQELVNANISVFDSNPLHICSVEQQTMAMVIAEHQPKVKTLLKDHATEYPLNQHFVHFIGTWKQAQYPGIQRLRQQYVDPYKNHKTQQLAQELVSLKAKNNNK